MKREISKYLWEKYGFERKWFNHEFKKCGEFNFGIICCDCGLKHDVVITRADDDLLIGFDRRKK